MNKEPITTPIDNFAPHAQQTNNGIVSLEKKALKSPDSLGGNDE